MNYGALLTQAQQNTKLNKKEFAKKLNISYKKYIDLESGKVKPTLEFLEILSIESNLTLPILFSQSYYFKRYDEQDILSKYIESKICLLEKKLYDSPVQQENSINRDYYRYIRTYSNQIKILINDLFKDKKEKSNLKFLDIGSGTNFIPHLVNEVLGYESWGLECDLFFKYVNYNLENNYFFEDMLTFQKYNEFDILYTYNPIINKELMFKAIDYIYDNMKPGAVLYFNSVSGIDTKYKNLIVDKIESIYKIIKQ